MKIFRNIELLDGQYGCNVYLIDGEVLIDTGTGLNFVDMKKQIEQVCDIRHLKTIVNTHSHFDHTGGDKKTRDWLKAKIAIHEKDVDDLHSANVLAEKFGTTARIITADEALNFGDFIRTTNFNFEVIHTPGHTPGSICLYEKDKKILISGDTLFADSVGRTDLPKGNQKALTDSLKIILDLNTEYLFPGHGPMKYGGISFVVKRMLNHLVEHDKFL